MTRYTIDIRQPSTHFLFTTVRLEGVGVDGSTSVGTGFFFDAAKPTEQPRVFLFTNNHVLEDCVRIRVRVHIASKSQEPWQFSVEREQWLTIENPLDAWVPHPDPTVDLCAASLSSVMAIIGPIPDLYFTTFTSATIPSAEEESRFPALMQIAMIGYPTGLCDEQNNLPLLRRGTTASHPSIDFDGRAEVVVDMACFPGSSGSPVVFHDLQYFASAIRFLGVLYAGPTISLEGEVILKKIPTRAEPTASVKSMIHLGYVIKGSKVLELANHIEGTAKGA